VTDELKSRFLELYPPHTCDQCGLEHVRVPHIHITAHVEGKEVQVGFAPFELVGVVEGSVRPGKDTELDTPAHVYGLFWGPPGAQEPAYTSILYMN
jgi:hypothetical protein